jgi:hypothetical protein
MCGAEYVDSGFLQTPDTEGVRQLKMLKEFGTGACRKAREPYVVFNENMERFGGVGRT